MPPILTPAACAALLLSLAGASVAHAQPARPSGPPGRVLDRDMSLYGDGPSRQRPDLMAEIRFRNQVVTGNAPGGRSFRGRVGYRDAGEFSGRLGSDDLFAFRRDSLFSGLAGAGFRGTDAVRLQMGLTTGNWRLPEGARSALSVPRAGAATGAGVDPGAIGIVPDITRRPARDVVQRQPEFGAPGSDRMNTLRSPSAFLAFRPLQPVVLGVRDEGAGDLSRLTASTLTGVQVQRVAAARRAADLDALRAEEAARNAASPGSPALAAGGAGAGPASNREDLSARTFFDDLRDRFATQGAGTAPGTPPAPGTAPGTAPVPGGATPPGAAPGAPLPPLSEDPAQRSWQGRVEELRRALQPGGPAPAPAPGTAPAPGSTLTPAPGEGAGVAQPAGEERAGRLSLIDAATAAVIRQNAGKTDRFVLLPPELEGRRSLNVRLPGGLGFDRFAEQMRQGQTALAERRYFDAEEQFSRALVSRPGDAAAMGGRINAQIGAGMYRSAAVNLRQLIAEHPEAAGVQYQGPALPALDRLNAVAAALRENLELGRLTSESALLLAYVGHQLGDAGMSAEGLDAYEREAGADEAAVLSFLRAVWLGRGSP